MRNLVRQIAAALVFLFWGVQAADAQEPIFQATFSDCQNIPTPAQERAIRTQIQTLQKQVTPLRQRSEFSLAGASVLANPAASGRLNNGERAASSVGTQAKKPVNQAIRPLSQTEADKLKSEQLDLIANLQKLECSRLARLPAPVVRGGATPPTFVEVPIDYATDRKPDSSQAGAGKKDPNTYFTGTLQESFNDFSFGTVTVSIPTTRKPPSETARHHAFNRSSAILSLGLADNEVLEVTYAPVQGFRCTSLGDWDNLTDTIFAVRAVQSTPGGLTGLMTGNNQIQAQRVVQTGPRSFAALLRARPIPSGAQPIRSSHNLEAAVGSELLGWAAQGLPGIKEITVSTDGLLSLIALDALELDGRPMLNRWELRYVSSFQHIRKPDQPAGVHMPGQALMIVFGDPDYGAPNVAATPSKEAAEKARTIVRGSTGNLVWAPLPAAGAEVDFLRSLFDLVPGQTLFRKKEATAANLRTLDENGRLAKSKYLVFATHAVADIEEPALSSIVLSRRAKDPPRVAYLTAAELATFSIGADLVYFSACETGYGRVVQGEGVLGLSAGVMTAGAKSTVATLWSVEDQASADFTKAFFDKIHHGKSPRVALVEVKKAFQNGRPAGSEFEWAPYVLTEQWE